MREGPRPPKKMDEVDESMFAFLGSRLERWEQLKDANIPLDDRKTAFMKETLVVLQTMQKNRYLSEADDWLLKDDMEYAAHLSGTEQEVADIVDYKINYYRALIQEFRKAIK